jgi:hypothetical protein
LLGGILTKNSLIQKYHCNNPNCGKCFAKPKIIKYYVCPTCQTLVDVPSQEMMDESEEKIIRPLRTKTKKPTKRKTKISQPIEEQERSAIIKPVEVTELSIPQIADVLPIPDLEDPIVERNAVDEASKVVIVEKSDPILEKSVIDDTSKIIVENDILEEASEVQNAFEEKSEPTSTVPLEEESQLSSAQEENPQSNSHCMQYFGYLGERGKGAEIPEDCFECSKAIECMMSKSDLSTGFEEIKKWYGPTK